MQAGMRLKTESANCLLCSHPAVSAALWSAFVLLDKEWIVGISLSDFPLICSIILGHMKE